MCSVRLANCSHSAHRGRNLCTGAVVKAHIWHKSCSAWVRIPGVRLSDEKHLSSRTDDYPASLSWLFFFLLPWCYSVLWLPPPSPVLFFHFVSETRKEVTPTVWPITTHPAWCGSFYRFLFQWQTIYITPTHQADVPMSFKWIAIYITVVMFITDMLDMCAFTMTRRPVDFWKTYCDLFW